MGRPWPDWVCNWALSPTGRPRSPVWPQGRGLGAWGQIRPGGDTGQRVASCGEAEFRGPKGRQWLMRWLPARAHDNGMFLVYSNGVGIDDDEVRTGNAMILDPYGDILAETAKPDDDLVVADLDAELLSACTGRRWIKTRRPELYGALSVPTGTEQDTRTVRFAKQ